jgi:CspA family cold shock protein
MPVVVHYDPPAQATDYLHRSGRTGRAGATGAVISLVGEDVIGQVKRLQKALGVPMNIESREDAPAIRLGAVDDAVASVRLDDRGGKGRSERSAPREHDRAPRGFERREPRERSYSDRGDRAARPERSFADRAPRAARGPEDRERPFAARSTSPDRSSRPERSFADRAPRSDRTFVDRNDRSVRPDRGSERHETRFNDRGTTPRSSQGGKEAVVSFFNDSKGFGFASDEKGDDLFIHFSSIEGDGFKSLTQGQKITFEEASGPKGREARHVRVVGGGRQRR